MTNALSRFGKFRTPPMSEVTVFDVAGQRVEDRWVVPEANLLLGVAWHPSGEFALATLNRTKNLVPMTRILQGWTITNGIAVLWKGGRVDQLLLDEPQRYFADITDVAFTPDGKTAFATSAGTDKVAVIDVEKMLALLKRTSDEDRRDVLPNWLGASSEFVTARIPVKDNPRGIAVAPDGATAWVANTLDDSLSVIDVARGRGRGPGRPRRAEAGDAHPLGRAALPQREHHLPAAVRLRHLPPGRARRRPHLRHRGRRHRREPGGQPDAAGDLRHRPLQVGGHERDPGAAVRGAAGGVLHPHRALHPEQLRAVNDYTVTIPRPPNRHRPLGAALSARRSAGARSSSSARARTTAARSRPRAGASSATSRRTSPTASSATWGRSRPLDRQGKFDVPHLNNIYDSAPYLHNGMANTLEEIWTVHNPYDTHGYTNDMTKDQLNDLIEYLKTL